MGIFRLGITTDRNTRFSDWTAAESSPYIDLIIGGHLHPIITTKALNAVGDSAQIIQDRHAGAYLGRVTLTFQRKTGR